MEYSLTLSLPIIKLEQLDTHAGVYSIHDTYTHKKPYDDL